MSKKIEFDPESHQYFVDGVNYPSVTKILEGAGVSDYSRVNSHVLENAAAEGNYLHKLLEAYDLGVLDESKIDDDSALIVKKWNDFLIFNKLSVISAETKLFSEKFKYCGTCDRVCIDQDNEFVLVEIKNTSQKMGSHDWQTAAYAQALIENGIKISKRIIFYTKQVQTSWDMRTDQKIHFDVFLSCLKVFNLKGRG